MRATMPTTIRQSLYLGCIGHSSDRRLYASLAPGQPEGMEVSPLSCLASWCSQSALNFRWAVSMRFVRSAPLENSRAADQLPTRRRSSPPRTVPPRRLSCRYQVRRHVRHGLCAPGVSERGGTAGPRIEGRNAPIRPPVNTTCVGFSAARKARNMSPWIRRRRSAA